MNKNYPKDAEELLSAILIKELKKSELNKVINCKDKNFKKEMIAYCKKLENVEIPIKNSDAYKDFAKLINEIKINII
tara:strand:- start:1596 stop:1826 length:231 start_codon:yes stop_codon:yes gene_type:complete